MREKLQGESQKQAILKELQSPPHTSPYEVVDVMKSFVDMFPFSKIRERHERFNPKFLISDTTSVPFAQRILDICEFLYHVFLANTPMESRIRSEKEDTFLDAYEKTMELMYRTSTKLNLNIRIPIILMAMRSGVEVS